MNKNKARAHSSRFILIAALASLWGCDDRPYGLAPMELSPPPQLAMAPATAPTTSVPEHLRVRSTLAYEHTVHIETSPKLLPLRLSEVEDACKADAPRCTVLEVSLQSHQNLPTGTVRMRLAPAAKEPLIAIASNDGKVSGRSTRAEDLAEPVADAERQLALMTLHRDRLTEIMRSKDLKVDQLLTVSKELAAVQTQIDSLNTQRANLQRRIDTELLTISFALPWQDYAAARTPVGDALRSFGADFLDAVGMVIRFLAVLLPWLVIILPGLFLLRLFWRWIGRRIARREGIASTTQGAL